MGKRGPSQRITDRQILASLRRHTLVRDAAKVLQCSPQLIYARIKRLGIKRGPFIARTDIFEDVVNQ